MTVVNSKNLNDRHQDGRFQVSHVCVLISTPVDAFLDPYFQEANLSIDAVRHTLSREDFNLQYEGSQHV